ncbi:hypothetical protein CJD36_018180 [Flavipsychrobacter stenotrophus]|uniref:Uncharacterized protein n=1 Tax=Flavipsychrobacter stenotrophus TaxID=2077091 RepID=A0A2S7SSH1_9BACT|nr:hypothetical protein [Flavipsychrobacter stenotrophus]PQJ09853.1 hypothetical protein CJD36_018180 [Flavipsychrobacter stenotrophus]
MNICSKHLLLFGCIFIFSCKDVPTKNHGPIKLGDSSTIVTESDPQRLQDLVTDLTPVIPSNIPPDTAKEEPKADTPQKAAVAIATPPAAAPIPSGPGLKAEFKEVTIMLPGLDAKQAGKPNLMNANGAVYTWTSGNINGNVMRTTGNVAKVSQRYQSVVLLKGKNGNLPLEDLSVTTPWQQVNGGNGAYPVKGLGENDLKFEDADANDIRNAVAKAGRQRHLSKKKIDEWMTVLGKNVRAANQKPLVVTLRSVMWKIDGKDEKGKIYSKQIRIDVPM